MDKAKANDLRLKLIGAGVSVAVVLLSVGVWYFWPSKKQSLSLKEIVGKFFKEGSTYYINSEVTIDLTFVRNANGILLNYEKILPENKEIYKKIGTYAIYTLATNKKFSLHSPNNSIQYTGTLYEDLENFRKDTENLENIAKDGILELYLFLNAQDKKIGTNSIFADEQEKFKEDTEISEAETAKINEMGDYFLVESANELLKK